ncbi:MAG TPA: hypothetical protein VJH23_02685 [archaeon]|nr:hypothetical protein [archaeon]
MVFWQAIHAIAGLDIGFFIDLVLNNILFVFLFYVMIHIFFGGKKTLYFFVLWGFLLWAIIDWQDITGIAFSGASFLLLYYASKLALLGFVESVPSLRKYIVVVSSVSAYFLMWFYTFFIGGA